MTSYSEVESLAGGHAPKALRRRRRTVVSYKTFLWALIKYWEWQHDGRRMKFSFWADECALPLALLVCAIVFFVTFKYIQQRRKS